MRINVDLGEDPPALDDKNKLTEVQTKTEKLLRTGEYKSMIEKVAHKLIASTFYFLKDERIACEDDSNWFICTGMVEMI